MIKIQSEISGEGEEEEGGVRKPGQSLTLEENNRRREKERD